MKLSHYPPIKAGCIVIPVPLNNSEHQTVARIKDDVVYYTSGWRDNLYELDCWIKEGYVRVEWPEKNPEKIEDRSDVEPGQPLVNSN